MTLPGGPVVLGLAIGVAVPMALIIVPLLSGHLVEAVGTVGAYPLLPAFALATVPAAFAGAWIVGRQENPGAILLRASVGALGAACAVGAVLLWFGYDEVDAARRLVLALTGAPALVGFWVWVGFVLGGYVQARRATPRTPA